MPEIHIKATDEADTELLADLTPAEKLGLAVAATFHDAVADINRAREIAVALEQELAEARRHLELMTLQNEARGSSWAGDNAETEAARLFLNRSIQQDG